MHLMLFFMCDLALQNARRINIRSDIKASVSAEGVLTLKGEQKEEEKEGAKKKSRRFSSFSRR